MVQASFNVEALRAVLERHRKARGLTPGQLSARAGLNATAVRDVMERVENPGVATVLALAQALGISPAALFVLYEQELLTWEHSSPRKGLPIRGERKQAK